MSLQGNSPKPRISITSSRNQDDLADLELPERSRGKIVLHPLANQPSLRGSQNQELDEQLYNLELLPDSHIMSKQNATATTSQTFVSQKNDSKNQPKNTAMLPQEATLKTTKNSPSVEKLMDAQPDAVEKSKRTANHHRTTREQQPNDNNQISQCLQNDEQIDIRKRIEEKIKNGYNYDRQGVGLKAKAEQLRKQNQLRERTILRATERQLDKKSAVSTEHNTEMHEPHYEHREHPNLKIEHARLDIKLDNNIDNANKKEANHHEQFEIKTREMTIASVLHYYSQEFKFNESEISNDSIGRSKKIIEEEEEQPNRFSFCACFRSKRPKTVNLNIPTAKRLVAIAKKQVTNRQEEEHILKEIWASFTNQKYARFGSHWIELGFQGKDPFTDLRSTGILSMLQWLQFIESHPKLSEKYYIWSLSHYYPMALTFIQITGIFLDLLSEGVIRSQSWEGFQRCYNCLVLGMFQKLIERYKLGQLIPNFVQNQGNEVRREFKRLFASYEQEYKAVQ